jgi:dTDP-4-amino-4,6-dideoxygalactose transaminase
MLNYGRQSIVEADIDAVTAVLRSDWLTTGPAVAEFERELAAVTGGTPCVSVTSGTAALHAAYGGLGLGPGDEVVTTPMTFVATASCAAQVGARVIFADVSDDTANLEPAAVEAAVTPYTRVVVGVDYAGHPIDADGLRMVCDQVGALLLEDAAHSIGGSYRGRPVGSLADITTLSFFPTKNLTTSEGGAVAVTDPGLLGMIRRFARIGMVREPAELHSPDEGGWWYEVQSFGLNYRLPDVLCALGTSQLRRLAGFVRRRQELVARYGTLLADVPGLRLPVRRDDVEPAWHLYAVRVLDGRRRELYDGLRARGIGAQVNYIPVYWHPVFADLGYRRGMCPVAERFYAEQLSLPLFPDLTETDQDRVVEAVRAVLGA